MKKKQTAIPEFELEEGHHVEAPSNFNGALIGESFPSLVSKVNLLESFFSILVKNISFHDCMRELLLAMLRVIKCEAGSILEVNHDEGVVFFRSAAGISSDRITHFVIPIGQGIVGHVIESKQPFLLLDGPENELHLRSIGDAVGFEVRNMIAVPIIVRGKVFGVIELVNRIGERGFLDGDVELTKYMAEVMSKVVECRMMISWKKNHRSGIENNE